MCLRTVSYEGTRRFVPLIAAGADVLRLSDEECGRFEEVSAPLLPYPYWRWAKSALAAPTQCYSVRASTRWRVLSLSVADGLCAGRNLASDPRVS